MHKLQAIAAVFALTTGLAATAAHGRDIMPEPLTIEEVRQQPIDVHAQRSLVRLSKGTQEQRFRAYHILRGIDIGALGGIYIVDQGVPALRAQSLGKGWWTLLQGKPAMCWMEPAGEKPLILLGKQTAQNPAAVDTALLQAFADCGFRELEVEIMRNGVPCPQATSIAALINEELGIDYGVRPSEAGISHFAMPPAMYGFEVQCDGQPTSPAVIYRAVAPGEGIQRERFDF